MLGASLPGLGHGILHFNDNSGAAAINLAYLKGATQIVLLGYEMNNTGGKAHWFGNHPDPLATGNYAVYIHQYTKLAQDLEREGVDVVNCSTNTALYQFRRDTLDNVL